MSTLRVYLFGKFQIRRNGQPVTHFEARKAQELFCYLLLHRARSHPREQLAHILWQDTTESRSKKYLRHALWQLQSSLNKSETSPILLVEAEFISIHPEADLWLDIWVLEQAFTRVKDVEGQAFGAQDVHLVREAVRLCKADLLEGWYQDWCLYERERLCSIYLSLLNKLMDYCEKNHEYETGISYGIRILRHDQSHERTHRKLMRLYYLAGDRTMALRQYERCAAILGEELAVCPTDKTKALYERIREGKSMRPFPLDDKEAHKLLPEVLKELRQLQATLYDVQQQVQNYILNTDR